MDRDNLLFLDWVFCGTSDFWPVFCSIKYFWEIFSPIENENSLKTHVLKPIAIKSPIFPKQMKMVIKWKKSIERALVWTKAEVQNNKNINGLYCFLVVLYFCSYFRYFLFFFSPKNLLFPFIYFTISWWSHKNLCFITKQLWFYWKRWKNYSLIAFLV